MEAALITLTVNQLQTHRQGNTITDPAFYLCAAHFTSLLYHLASSLACFFPFQKCKSDMFDQVSMQEHQSVLLLWCKMTLIIVETRGGSACTFL